MQNTSQCSAAMGQGEALLLSETCRSEGQSSRAWGGGFLKDLVLKLISRLAGSTRKLMVLEAKGACRCLRCLKVIRGKWPAGSDLSELHNECFAKNNRQFPCFHFFYCSQVIVTLTWAGCNITINFWPFFSCNFLKCDFVLIQNIFNLFGCKCSQSFLHDVCYKSCYDTEFLGLGNSGAEEEGSGLNLTACGWPHELTS